MRIRNNYFDKIRSLKQAVKKRRGSKNPFIRFCFFSYDFLNKTRRFCVNAEYRAICFMRLFRPGSVAQTTPLTGINRYPAIFSACRDYFRNEKVEKDIRILSFGCSTGEEVLTLRDYFPDAEIVGAEINRNSLRICQKLIVDKKIAFIYSKKRNIARFGPYDAVFCMAVLQRTPNFVMSEGITDLGKIYPFQKFEKQVNELDRHINSGGLFVITYAQYMFKDANASHKYKALGYKQNVIMPAFDKNSRLKSQKSEQDVIYVKTE